MAKSGHQFVHTYRNPISPGTVISVARPGEKLAAAVTEIQDVISNMQGTDGEAESIIDQIKDDPTTILPADAETWQVITWNGTAWVADYVRATA